MYESFPYPLQIFIFSLQFILLNIIVQKFNIYG